MGIKITKTCDRCGNVINRATKTYKNINDLHRESASKDFMKMQLKDGYNYNLMVNFSNFKWEPNTDPRIFPGFNGFTLCTDCIEELEKFLMNKTNKI